MTHFATDGSAAFNVYHQDNEEVEAQSGSTLIGDLKPEVAANDVVEDQTTAQPYFNEKEIAEMIKKYSPLVRQITGGFQRKLPRNVLRDDLLAAGMSGLWDAVRRQVSEPSERFESYVRVRIRGAILDELRAQDWLPRRARAAAAEAQEKGNHAKAYAPSVVRLNDVSEWDQNRCLSTGESQSSYLAVEQKFMKEQLTRAVDQLPPRERHIVAAHYFQGTKFKDLGIELGVSEPRISQLHSRAMQRLKGLMAHAA